MIPLSTIVTAEKFYLPLTSKHTPGLMVEGNDVPTMPMIVGESSGHHLTMLVTLHGDNTSHENSLISPERYLHSFNTCISLYIPGLKVVGDTVDGNTIRHNVVEIGEIEVDSVFDILRMYAAVIRVDRLLAKPPVL